MTPQLVRSNERRHEPTGQAVRAWALPVLLLVLAVVLAACGGEDDGAEATAAAGTTAPGAEAAAAASPTTGSDADAAAAATAESDADAAAAGDLQQTLEDLASDTGSAVVTIGDEAYEFSLAGTTTVDGTTYVGRCQVIFDLIMAGGYASDGRDVTVDLEIPPTDWETYTDDRYGPPAIEVEDNENDVSWVADQGNEFVSGSGILEYAKDGATASGTATFVNQWEPDSEPIEGSFEVTCEG